MVGFALFTMLLGGLALTSPAQADHGLGVGHWSNFEWTGLVAPNSHAARGFYILDRTGNSTASQALQDAINDYAYDQAARGWQGLIPNVVYANQSNYAGQCGAFTDMGGGTYHFVTVCLHGGMNGGVTYSSSGHHGEPSHPWIYLGVSHYNTYTYLRNVFYHELLHAVGVTSGPCTNTSSGVQNVGYTTGDHSCDPANLMYPIVPINTIKRPTGHDMDAMGASYLPHPMFS